MSVREEVASDTSQSALSLPVSMIMSVNVLVGDLELTALLGDPLEQALFLERGYRLFGEAASGAAVTTNGARSAAAGPQPAGH
jgi:hypothetical protein